MKLTRISRIIRLLTTLQAGKNYNASQLAALAGVSKRTVFRDLKELQAIGLQYHYDPLANAYTVDPEFFLQPVDFNIPEALALLMLAHKGKGLLPEKMGKAAVMAAIKVENNLPDKIKRYCNTAIEKITIKTAHSNSSQKDNTFFILQKAVNKKLKVKILYNSLFEKNAITTILSPYHLMHNHRSWYIIGHSQTHNQIRTFKLNRISNITTLDKAYIKNDFEIDEYLGRAWSMIPEGKIYNIKLRFTPKVATNVSETAWHPTQLVNKNPDGSADISFRVDGLNEITWWILGYGDQVTVLAPEKLRKKIKLIAKNIQKINS